MEIAAFLTVEYLQRFLYLEFGRNKEIIEAYKAEGARGLPDVRRAQVGAAPKEGHGVAQGVRLRRVPGTNGKKIGKFTSNRTLQESTFPPYDIAIILAISLY